MANINFSIPEGKLQSHHAARLAVDPTDIQDDWFQVEATRANTAHLLITALEEYFNISDKADLYAPFMESGELITKQLIDIKKQISNYFPGDRLELELVTIPESQESELGVWVWTSLGVEQALEKLDHFDDEWWCKASDDNPIPIVVDVRYL